MYIACKLLAWQDMSRSFRITLLIVALVTLAGVVVLLQMPENTRFWQETFTAGHAIIFGLTAIAILHLSNAIWGARIRPRLVHYALAGIGAILIGIATEIIQSYVGRDAELADVYRDALGAFAFLCVAMTFDNRLRWDFRTGHFARWAVRLAAPLLIVLVFGPAIKWGVSYAYRDMQMPVVGSFNSKVMRQFMRTAGCKLEVTQPPEQWYGMKERVGQLTFYPGTYPGILFRELSPNWSAYDSLIFEIYSELEDTVSVELRVNDRHHNEKYSDRFNQVLKIRPGINHVGIPLEKVREAPASRSMDMTDMGTIVLFAYKTTDTFSLYLSDLRLE